MVFPIPGIVALPIPVPVDHRYFNDIRIDRVKLFSGTKTIYLRPERGISCGTYARHCHFCGVSWQIALRGERDLLQCAVDGIDRYACWCCGDTTFLPAVGENEMYDTSWYTYDR